MDARTLMNRQAHLQAQANAPLRSAIVTAHRIAEHSAMAGMMLGRFDPKRTSIVCTTDNMRGKVPAAHLRVPSTDLSKSVGAAGAQLVAWIARDRVAGVVWMKSPDKVRYTEGRPEDLLPEDVRRVMRAEGWD
jgi:hypothetical protein